MDTHSYLVCFLTTATDHRGLSVTDIGALIIMELETSVFDSVFETTLETDNWTFRIERSEAGIAEELQSPDGYHGGAAVLRRVKRPSRLESCLKSHKCSVCVYLIVVSALLSSVVSVIVVGLAVIVPYYRANSFLRASCSVLYTVRSALDQRCYCGEGCYSNVPCVRVAVRLFPTAASEPSDRDFNSSWTAVISDNESILRRQCSFYPECVSSASDNRQTVSRYVNSYGRRYTNFSCLYNPRHVTDVIRTRRFRRNHVINGMFWPMLTLIASSLSLDLMLRYRGCSFL